MNKKFNWKLVADIAMLVLSIVFYFIHYLIFRDAHHIFIYLVGDIAFVFVEVLLVTIIIHHVLHEWEKQSHLKKLNMVIETFFSDFGKNLNKIHDLIVVEDGCEDMDFKSAFKGLKSYKADIDINKIELKKLSNFLTTKREFLIRLLQNPNLLEHATFTETVMAIFHITEELAARDLDNLPKEDIEHTKIDIERAYNLLTYQWLSYMEYTKKNFPYFFLFAMRTNPFDEHASWLDKYESAVA